MKTAKTSEKRHHKQQLRRHRIAGSALFVKLPYCFATLLVFLRLGTIDATFLQGCNFDESLCDESEACVQDGLFGQCFFPGENGITFFKPLILEKPLSEIKTELLQLELTRLAKNGYDWPHALSQCVLAYFKVSIAYGLDYDRDFCNVRNPANIWQLVQRVQALLGLEDERSLRANQTEEIIPVFVNDPADEDEELITPAAIIENNEEQAAVFPVLFDYGEKADDGVYSAINDDLVDGEEQGDDDREAVSVDRDAFLRSALEQLAQQQEEAISEQDGEEGSQLGPLSAPELEEAIPLTSEANQKQLLLKKDSERFGNVDMGLANTVHKIVKGGGVQLVEGSRVYLKVAKENLTKEELYKIISYLDENVAKPNRLYFDDFSYEAGQLSFKITKLDFLDRKTKSLGEEVESASGVAEAVYKRRNDILTMVGVEVDETGIGDGVDGVPIKSSKTDVLFIPILAVCAFTIATLVGVMAIHVYNRTKRNGKFSRSYLPEVIDHLEGKPSTVYEDLCRQRMTSQDIPVAVNVGGSPPINKTSRTFSWGEENACSSIDISTGHVLLSYLQECLDKPTKISDQWNSVCNYQSTSATTMAGSAPENKDKNFDNNYVPYDDNAVTLKSQSTTYINASKISDANPQQVVYIASQAPTKNTVNDFYEMIWQQGVALVVNLCDQRDLKNERIAKYWPEEGSSTFGTFEIHLVSEHIWSEHYLVRSLYLKNLNTNETRTITQFHFLSWPNHGCPAMNKSLLEFRRKVNKSYRGKASPILIHCTNGSGRTGCYCLIDMVTNRIQSGIKELNIVASLEYLRDQRMGMVGNEEQFQMVFSSVSEEIMTLLKQH